MYDTDDDPKSAELKLFCGGLTVGMDQSELSKYDKVARTFSDSHNNNFSIVIKYLCRRLFQEIDHVNY
jgi:hypothetical protein